MERLRSVQVLRGVAACAVVVLHSYEWGHPVESSPVRIGAAGVDLFFVISGFIIASIPKRSSFLFDRVWRVYPVWLVASVPWLFVAGSDWRVILSTVTHWPIYGDFVMPVLPLGWTLSFEVLFYFAAALAIATRPGVPLAMFGLFLGGGILTDAPIFDLLGNPMIFEFLFGMVVARFPRDQRFGIPLLIGAIVLLAVSPLGMYPGEFATSADRSWARALFWGFPCALIVYGCLCLERYFRNSLLGNASFSIYLWHLPVIQFLPFDWAVEVALSVLVGVVMWRLVERPIQDARDGAWLKVSRLMTERPAQPSST